MRVLNEVKIMPRVLLSFFVLIIALMSCSEPQPGDTGTTELSPMDNGAAVIMDDNDDCFEDPEPCGVQCGPPPPPDGFQFRSQYLKSTDAPDAWRLNLHRAFRDNVLKTGENYSRYIDYYYNVFSKEVSYLDLSLKSQLKLLSALSKMDEPLHKMMDNDFKGVIVDQELFDVVIEVAKDLEGYMVTKGIAAEFERDLQKVVGLTKEQIELQEAGIDPVLEESVPDDEGDRPEIGNF